MLYKLAPKPVENSYLPDTPEVLAVKKEILEIFRNVSDRPDMRNNNSFWSAAQGHGDGALHQQYCNAVVALQQ
jgi:hypothetical protein